MARRTAARVLAPLALLGGLLAVLLVIASGGGGSSDAGSATVSPGTSITGSETTDEATTTTETGDTAGSGAGPRFYTVKDGDVLSAIADSTGVPLETIEELNPDVDAQTLRAGQRIKLRP